MNFLRLGPNETVAVGDLICFWKDAPEAFYHLADAAPVGPGKPCIAVGYGEGGYSVRDVQMYNPRIDICIFRDVTPAGGLASDYMTFLFVFSKNYGNPGLLKLFNSHQPTAGYKQTKTGMPLRIPMNPIYSQPLPLP